MLDLFDILAVDNHCHLPLLGPPPVSEADLARFLTEATDPEVLATQTPDSLFFRRAVKDLAALLIKSGASSAEETGADAMLAQRARIPAEEWFGIVVKEAGVSTLLADTGYPRSGAWTVEQAQATLNKQEAKVEVRAILRIERILEDLILQCDSFEQCEEALRVTIREARSKGAVGLKSILAYRCGLDIRRDLTSASKAKGAFILLKEETRKTGTYVRVADKELLDFIVPAVMEEAALLELPVQFHTGFGDTDADLIKANPAYLRPLFEDKRLRKAPIVLLHCFPYLQEASYLAAMYPQVFLDFSLSSPLVAFGGGHAVEDALGLAPSTKIMYGSDAWGIPDVIYLGSLHSRRKLGLVLQEWIDQGWLEQKEARHLAENILANNAKKLYGV